MIGYGVLAKMIDLFLAGYSDYHYAVYHARSDDEALFYLERALRWFQLFGDYAGFDSRARLETVIDQIMIALREDKVLDDEFILEKEQEIQEAFTKWLWSVIQS